MRQISNRGIGAKVQVKRLLEVASSHTSALRDAADQVAYLWGELEDGKAPPQLS